MTRCVRAGVVGPPARAAYRSFVLSLGDPAEFCRPRTRSRIAPDRVSPAVNLDGVWGLHVRSFWSNRRLLSGKMEAAGNRLTCYAQLIAYRRHSGRSKRDGGKPGF